MADRQGAFRHEEAPASAAEKHVVVAVVAAAGIGNRRIVMFLVACKI
jgi:hypothetical protein